MKLLGITQGSNLRVFLRLAGLLKEPLGLNGVSAYVADSQEFYALRPKEPTLRRLVSAASQRMGDIWRRTRA